MPNTKQEITLQRAVTTIALNFAARFQKEYPDYSHAFVMMEDLRVEIKNLAQSERDKAWSEAKEEIESLRAENERLKTTLVAGAELIKENWSKLCDDEGYGPQNLLLRMDGTLNTSGYPGYSSGEFEKLRKRCEDLEAIKKALEYVDPYEFSSLAYFHKECEKLLSQ